MFNTYLLVEGWEFFFFFFAIHHLLWRCVLDLFQHLGRGQMFSPVCLQEATGCPEFPLPV